MQICQQWIKQNADDQPISGFIVGFGMQKHIMEMSNLAVIYKIVS